MTPEQRILRCLLLDKMYKDSVYAKKLGLEDRTTFMGKRIQEIQEEKKC